MNDDRNNDDYEPEMSNSKNPLLGSVDKLESINKAELKSQNTVDSSTTSSIDDCDVDYDSGHNKSIPGPDSSATNEPEFGIHNDANVGAFIFDNVKNNFNQTDVSHFIYIVPL